MPKPLSSIRVLDLTRVLAGPWATQLLADLGAEVIKVERVDGGDDTRSWGPPYFEGETGEGRESAYFLSANRGKSSICVDIRTPQGQAIIRALAAKSDILIENFKVGTLEKYGLGYEQLKRGNEKLIFCSITGFGQTGPFALRPGYDLMMQGMGGLMSITGHPDGTAGGGAMKVGVALVDVLTGLYATNAIQAALHHRNVTQKGQAIDISLLDCLAASLANQSMNYLVTGDSPERMGNDHPSIVPYGVFKASDEEFILAVGNDGQFQAMCAAAGASEIAVQEKYATNSGRVKNRDALKAVLADVFARKTAQDWLDILEEAGVPCGPVNDIGAALNHPQIQARGMVQARKHETLGEIPVISNPINLSDVNTTSDAAPPSLGASTARVLTDILGYCAEDIEALRRGGIINEA